METAVGVGEQRVAAVDDDVAVLQQGREFVDDVVDRLAGLDHDDHDPWLGESRDETLEVLGGCEAALMAELFDQLVGALAVAVVERDAEAFAGSIAGQVGAHDGEPHHAEIT